MNEDWTALRDEVAELTKSVGAFIADAAQNLHQWKVEEKVGGDSPSSQVVTEVDRQAETKLKLGLQSILRERDWGWLGEEGGDDRSRLKTSHHFCVDPLDGTLAFVNGEKGFCVSIALVRCDGRSLMGLAYDPMEHRLYDGIEGGGCRLNGKSLRVSSHGPVHLLFDKTWQRHPKRDEVRHWAQKKGWLVEENTWGSVLNACSLLHGRRGLYCKFPKPSQGGGSHWDFASTAAMMPEAGGWVSDMHGSPLHLNDASTTFHNQRGVIFASDVVLAREMMEHWRTIR